MMPSLPGRLMSTPWLARWMSASMSVVFSTSNGTAYAQPLPVSVVWMDGTAGETAIVCLAAKGPVKVKNRAKAAIWLEVLDCPA